MSSKRQLKNKIRAVGNIKQITCAMEMVAATKMRKAQEVALRARPYAKKSFALLLHLLKQADKEKLESIFWTDDRVSSEKIALVVITSDKGLAGSFNSSVLRKAAQWKTEQTIEGKQVEIVAVGRKGRDFFKRRRTPVAAEFFKFSDIITYADVRPLADWIVQTYEKHEYDKVVVCSNQFISALVQRVEVHAILPLQIEELQRTIEGIIPKTGRYSEVAKEEREDTRGLSYVLEPSGQAITETLVRNLVQVLMTYFVFESNASEHLARMLAMKNATDNAEDLQEELQLLLNKARQTAITQEIAEVTTAKEALTTE